jgi:STE24 endopeptidase
MPTRRSATATVVIAIAIALAASAALAQGAPTAADPAAPQVAPAAATPAPFPTVRVTDEMREHQRIVDTLYFASAFYGLAILLAVLALGISRRLRDLATRLTARPALAAMVFWALLTLVTTALSAPLDYYEGFAVPHRFALSSQSFGGWAWDQAKGMLLGIVIGAPLVALALAGIRRVRRWWLALWLGSVPITVFLILVAPVVLDPVFNTFKPLEDQQLKNELLDLAARAGISGSRVYEVDKSKQTKTMNAYVNGLGPTKRIVLWDTIIAKMKHDELRMVMAHEMGHYVLHHVWKLLGFLLVLLLAAFWLMQRGTEWAISRWGRSWGFEVAHDPAAVPLLMLVVSAFMFLASPLVNGVSRHFEHEADTFSLELTHLNDAGARAFVKFAEDSKVLPDPAPFIRFWRYSHPTLAERIVFCETYKPWEKGEPNRVWRGTPAP